MGKSKSYKVVKEVAKNEFESWCEAMDIDDDTISMDDEDRSGFEANKARIIRAVMRGHLTFNGDGEAVYIPFRPKTLVKDAITFYEKSGAALQEMDKKGKDADVKKTFCVMAANCCTTPSVFSGMFGTDLDTCLALNSLLTG